MCRNVCDSNHPCESAGCNAIVASQGLSALAAACLLVRQLLATQMITCFAPCTCTYVVVYETVGHAYRIKNSVAPGVKSLLLVLPFSFTGPTNIYLVACARPWVAGNESQDEFVTSVTNVVQSWSKNGYYSLNWYTTPHHSNDIMTLHM